MSSVPTGRGARSIAAILAARRWASVTPRVRRPTNARSLAPPLRSRISWAMRVSARSRAASSSTCAFSRRRGRVVIISPYEPRWAHLKERAEPNVTLPGWPRSCQRLVAGGQQRHELIEVDRLGDERIAAGLERLAHVVALALAGQRDETGPGQRAAAPEPARDLHAVHVRQPDVAQHDLGMLALGQVDALDPAAGHVHPGAFRLQHEPQDDARVVVVLHDEHRPVVEAAHGARARAKR